MQPNRPGLTEGSLRGVPYSSKNQGSHKPECRSHHKQVCRSRYLCKVGCFTSGVPCCIVLLVFMLTHAFCVFLRPALQVQKYIRDQAQDCCLLLMRIRNVHSNSRYMEPVCENMTNSAPSAACITPSYTGSVQNSSTTAR